MFNRIVLLMSFLVSCTGASVLGADSKNPFDLIEAARKQGTITDAQAALYGAQVFRGTQDLPEAYRGDPQAAQVNTTPGHLHVAMLIGQFPKLSLPEQKQALRLIAPPAYVWKPARPKALDDDGDNGEGEEDPQPDPDPSWITVENLDVKVWYRKEDPNGATYAKTLASSFGSIRDRLVALMDRGPLADDGESYGYELKDGTKINLGNGGNGKMDIYLMPLATGSKTYAYTMPYVSLTKPIPTPAFLVFNTGIPMDEDRLKATLGHELMHAIQFAFPKLTDQLEEIPMNEGVAKWAEEFLYPDKHYAHEWPDFTMYTWTSLLSDSYATWTFYYYLQHELGETTLRMIYENMATHHPYDAIDATITGGFKKQWPLFAVKDWNQLPNDDSFWKWDKYGFTPYEAKDVPIMEKPMAIGGTGDFVERHEFDMLPLSRRYLFYAVDKKTKARSIAIEMAHFFQLDKIFLKALVKYQGSDAWKTEEWNSQMEAKEFCLDMTQERIEKIVLIYSNFDHKGAEPLKVRTVAKATNIGCYTYKGKIKGRLKSAGVTLDMDTDAVFKVVDRMHREAGDNGGHMPGRFDLASVKVGYTYQGKQQGCTAFENGSVEASGPEMRKSGALGMYPYHESTLPNGRKYSGNIAHPVSKPLIATYHCPDGHSFTLPYYLYPWLVGNYGVGFGRIAGDTGLVQGKGLVNAPQTGATTLEFDYTLSPVAQDE